MNEKIKVNLGGENNYLEGEKRICEKCGTEFTYIIALGIDKQICDPCLVKKIREKCEAQDREYKKNVQKFRSPAERAKIDKQMKDEWYKPY